MVRGSSLRCKQDRFAATPWTAESEAWQALDRQLLADHLARRIDRAVGKLDLKPLFASYRGAGKRALRPDLLLKLVLYELQHNRSSPAQWAVDVRENAPLRWLLFGMLPSRSRLYDFRDRIAPFLREWNIQVLQLAVERGMTSATRVALDSSSVAAQASRRQLLNEARLQKRCAVIAERLQHLDRPLSTAEKLGWLARTPAGLRSQQRRYRHALAVLHERRLANAQRRSSKRKPVEKILVSTTDPDAVLARDKLNVFRPLYSVQLLRDLDSPLILSYDALAQVNDNGVVEPMIERAVDGVGCKPAKLLVDSGYVSIRHLEFCQQAGITLYGPYQENDFSEQNGKKPLCNNRTELPKSAFRWLEAEQVYQCPEGHKLRFNKFQKQQRKDHFVLVAFYTCPGELCLACPRQPECTRTPKKGRTVSRMEHEELLDTLRERMRTDEARRLYKLRSQTVELNYADLKEHRGLRRFHGRGLDRVTAEIGMLVLAHNLHYVAAPSTARDPMAKPKPPQIPCAA